MIPRDGSFGEYFAGQFILPDNNSQSLCRIMIEKVDGVHQGMATYLLSGSGLRSGNNRHVFSPDGKQLYIGQTVRGWGKLAEGLQRLTYNGGTPFDVATINITPDGFKLNFTKDIPEIKPSDISVTSAVYQPRWTYGSPAEDKRTHQITIVESNGNQSVSISLSGFEPGRLYEIKLPELKDSEETNIHNQLFYYTVHKIPGK